ncbi:MAG TPA: DUF1501 domain-containing protein [Steroidobacteraceae bacterium]|nr:DUF1501 domain-containing protein [Steroidobacteraceae bacterium]
MASRREFLRMGLGAGAALRLATLPGVSFAAAGGGESRLVVVILRGALDGLSAVPPYGDRDYAAARGPLAIRPPGEPQGALDLDGFFGLHPALTGLHERWQARELIVVHATASPYRERSHFDGQNVLENGGDRPSGAASGWLNRALGALPPPRGQGLALGQNVPLILRGPAPVGSWAPSLLPEVEPELVTRLRDLYSNDATLAARLDEATRIGALADEEGAGGAQQMARAGNAARLKAIAETAGRMLAAEGGPRVAVMDAGGWDTHAGEGAADGQLAGRLRTLDQGLAALRTGLADAWARSVVLVCTEFGRTVETNGTRGTDHGTGAAALLVGGALAGGRVLADWPGLAPRHRHEGRDLKPTTDLRAVAKGLLADHLRVPAPALGAVFPGAERLAPLAGLVRA